MGPKCVILLLQYLCLFPTNFLTTYTMPKRYKFVQIVIKCWVVIKFLHWLTNCRGEIITAATTPQACSYTTLWNVSRPVKNSHRAQSRHSMQIISACNKIKWWLVTQDQNTNITFNHFAAILLFNAQIFTDHLTLASLLFAKFYGAVTSGLSLHTLWRTMVQTRFPEKPILYKTRHLMQNHSDTPKNVFSKDWQEIQATLCNICYIVG